MQNAWDKRGKANLPTINRYSKQYGIPKEIMIKQQAAESAFNPEAVSNVGAFGLTQFMPATAKKYGVQKGDVPSQIRGQAKYLADLKKQFNGDLALALFAYHQGPKNVRRWLRGEKFKTSIGRKYVKNIMGLTLPRIGSNYRENT